LFHTFPEVCSTPFRKRSKKIERVSALQNRCCYKNPLILINVPILFFSYWNWLLLVIVTGIVLNCTFRWVYLVPKSNRWLKLSGFSMVTIKHKRSILVEDCLTKSFLMNFCSGCDFFYFFYYLFSLSGIVSLSFPESTFSNSVCALIKQLNLKI
jgi:hypothetical protein